MVLGQHGRLGLRVAQTVNTTGGVCATILRQKMVASFVQEVIWIQPTVPVECAEVSAMPVTL